MDVYDDLFISDCRFIYHVIRIVPDNYKTLKPNGNGFEGFIIMRPFYCILWHIVGNSEVHAFAFISACFTNLRTFPDLSNTFFHHPDSFFIETRYVTYGYMPPYSIVTHRCHVETVRETIESILLHY